MTVIRPRNRTPALGTDCRDQPGRHTHSWSKWITPPPHTHPTAPCFSGRLSPASKLWCIIHSIFLVYFQRLYHKALYFKIKIVNTLIFSISNECRLCRVSKGSRAERIEWFIEDQAFCRIIRLLGHPHPTCPVSKSFCVLPVGLSDGRGWARSQILRSQESLDLYILQFMHYSLITWDGYFSSPTSFFSVILTEIIE